jgi:hypothetical protein
VRSAEGQNAFEASAPPRIEVLDFYLRTVLRKPNDYSFSGLMKAS